MKSRARTPGPAAIVGAALGGVALAHFLAYLIALPGTVERQAHMTATGHAFLPAMVAVASGAAGAALLGVSLRAITSARELALVPTAARLAAVQVPAFALLEVCERHANVTAALSDPPVQIGLVLQVLVALGAALLLRGIDRGVQAATRFGGHRARAARALRLRHPEDPRLPRRVLLVAARRRAPPLPLAA